MKNKTAMERPSKRFVFKRTSILDTEIVQIEVNRISLQRRALRETLEVNKDVLSGIYK